MFEESAKGRPAIRTGIKHKRALQSHTKLKLRAPTKTVVDTPKLLPSPKPEAGNQSGKSDEGESEEGDSDGEMEEMRKELALLRKSQAGKVSKPAASAMKSRWRRDTIFSGKTSNSRGLQKSKESRESQVRKDFLDKYIA